MNRAAIEKRFEEFLRGNSLKLTAQRKRIFDRAFDTHEHFSAEELYDWLRRAEGPRVSRATVYRTLDLLERGEFIESMDTGRGERVYEHVLGHHHHDHMICLDCGRIQEFHDERIEALQEEAAREMGFVVQRHEHRLLGLCANCARKSGASRTGVEGSPAGARAGQEPG